MSPTLPAAVAALRRCPACGSPRLTISREQEVEIVLRSGDAHAGYRVEAVVTRAACTRCSALLYREVDRGRGGVDVHEAAGGEELAEVVDDIAARFARLEVM